VTAALRGTDLFVLGGGSLLQDATSARSVLWYTLMAWWARRLSRRILWWGQGVGPLRSPASRRLVRRIASHADAVTVRDPGSAQLLKDIGVRGSIEEVGDPGLRPGAIWRERGGSHGTPGALLALRPWRQDAPLRALLGRGTLGKVAAPAGGAVLYPMHLPGDETWVHEVGGAAGLPVENWQTRGDTPERALGRFCASGLVIAMRLHALIFAARCGVPFVALSYDPKVDALARAAGQDDALIAVDGVTEARLAEAVRRVWATRAERSQHLRAFGEVQAARARRPAQIAAGWLTPSA
jgi:polysaccharide pyruvyl transferase CsaB